jgi:hypothetical protein
MKVWKYLTVLLTLALLTACTAPPRVVDTDETPIPPVLVNPFDYPPVKAVFLIEVTDAQGYTLERPIRVQVEAAAPSGRLVSWIDDKTGEKRPGPAIYERQSPWEYTATLGPEIISVIVIATYAGAPGDEIECLVFANGQQINQGLNTSGVIMLPGGIAAATCAYSVTAMGTASPGAPPPTT